MDPRDQQPFGDDGDKPGKDYLGRVLIGFIIASALLWLLVYIF